MKQLLTYKIESYTGAIFILAVAVIALIISWRAFVNVKSDIETINVNIGREIN